MTHSEKATSQLDAQGHAITPRSSRNCVGLARG